MANENNNITPSLQNPDGLSPLQLFSDSPVDVNVKHFKPFGCPVYVLDPSIQEGNKGRKWKERSKVGIYLGQSPIHSRNVALVLAESGHASPQFHVAFDPGFQTVREPGGMVDRAGASWKHKCHFATRESAPDSVADTNPVSKTKGAKPKYPLGASAGSGGAAPQRSGATQRKRNVSFQHEGATDTPSSEGAGDIGRAGQRQQDEIDHLQEPVQPLDPPMATGGSDQANDAPAGKRSRLGSAVQPAARLIKAMTTEIIAATKDHDVQGEILCLQAMYPYPTTQGDFLAMKAAADPDTMYLHEASMREPDKKAFLEAMQKEVDDQMANGNYEIILRSEVPAKEKVLGAVWQMRRKRDIRTREIKKHKARMNVDGSQMIKGKHYDQTYSPVAGMNAIRLLLIDVATRNLKTRQLDYVQAFPQAPVQRDLYMRIPKGIKIEDGNTDYFVLKLKKNVYGQKDAGRVWFQYLKKKLIKEVGFEQSVHDECVFYRGNVMYVLHTDNSLISGPCDEEIDQVIEDIKKAGLDITVEGTIEDFLGINIDRHDGGTIHMTQPHLINQILSDLNFQANTKSKDTPAKSSTLLERHSESEALDGAFHYKSLIGKLGYLEKGTRSDLSYIAHQCARFSSNPKKEHGDAIQWIGRYLLGTRDKGTILRPDSARDMEVYVDADLLVIGTQQSRKIAIQHDQDMVT